MKVIAFIISIIILCLSVKPCSDGSNIEDASIHKNDTSHNHQNDSDDSCSFTCSCSCCGISITYSSISVFSIKKTIQISRIVFTEYTTNYVSGYLSKIWQPPQLIA